MDVRPSLATLKQAGQVILTSIKRCVVDIGCPHYDGSVSHLPVDTVMWEGKRFSVGCVMTS